jgi:hypothetical protein
MHEIKPAGETGSETQKNNSSIFPEQMAIKIKSFLVDLGLREILPKRIVRVLIKVLGLRGA